MVIVYSKHGLCGKMMHVTESDFLNFKSAIFGVNKGLSTDIQPVKELGGQSEDRKAGKLRARDLKLPVQYIKLLVCYKKHYQSHNS
jgi:hypothetical protein